MSQEEKKVQEIIEEIEKLPEFEQNAIKWILDNWALVNAMCRQETSMSDEEIEKKIQWAFDKQDYVAYALLFYLKQLLKERNTEK